MRRITGRWLKRYATSGVLMAGFVICLAADLPGHLSYDSVIQLLEGRMAQYSSWHPPVMSWLLGLFDAVVPGTALFVVFDMVLFFGALVSLVWLRPVRSWAGVVVAGLMIATPQVLIYQGIVWKDVLFADAAIAGCVSLAWAAARWQRERLRFGLIAVSMVLLVLASMARQNGILVLGFAVLALGWIATLHASRRLRAFAMYVLGAAAFAALVLTSANVALGWRIVAESGPAKQFRLLQVYDIIGFVVTDKTLPLNELHAYAPDLEEQVRTNGVRLYNPERNDPLAGAQDLQDDITDAPWDAIRGQWLDLIIHHPLDYLKIRGEVFRWVFATPDLSVCLPYLVGISGPEAPMQQLGISEREDEKLGDYAQGFVGTPVLSHPFWAVIAMACFVLLLLRRRPEDIAVASLLAGTLSFTASFFAIGIACDYRYCYALDLSALVALFTLALDPRSVWETLPLKWLG
jgi:hypothetical protein